MSLSVVLLFELMDGSHPARVQRRTARLLNTAAGYLCALICSIPNYSTPWANWASIACVEHTLSRPDRSLCHQSTEASRQIYSTRPADAFWKHNRTGKKENTMTFQQRRCDLSLLICSQSPPHQGRWEYKQESFYGQSSHGDTSVVARLAAFEHRPRDKEWTQSLWCPPLVWTAVRRLESAVSAASGWFLAGGKTKKEKTDQRSGSTS